ncbi:MAG: MFS transporter, partial [Gammaproteobacteria bacterium]|nr:MFS transporter [Gammaproteobacteria bacterium]
MRTLRASPLLVLCFGGTILALAVGMRQSFGLFLLPIISDLGWGRETFSLAIAIQNLVWGLTQPFFAMAADRWGTHRAVMVGGVLYTIGLYFMASPSGAVEFSFTAGVLIGLA